MQALETGQGWRIYFCFGNTRSLSVERAAVYTGAFQREEYPGLARLLPSLSTPESSTFRDSKQLGQSFAVGIGGLPSPLQQYMIRPSVARSGRSRLSVPGRFTVLRSPSSKSARYGSMLASSIARRRLRHWTRRCLPDSLERVGPEADQRDDDYCLRTDLRQLL